MNDDEGGVQVFRFWQNERVNQVFKQHNSPVRSIVWMEDDTGFITTGREDHKVILWRIKPKVTKDGAQPQTVVWQYE